MPENNLHRAAILTHPELPHSALVCEQVALALRQQGVTVVECAPQAEDYDLLIAMGGDGTMLRAGQISARLGVPVLGINLGRFGFLTEIEQGGWPQALQRLLDGNYRVEQRMMLHIEHRRQEQTLDVREALNEAVVCRGGSVRPVRLRAWIDDLPLTNYMADGLIAATATGSTAYALAAGGPVLPPEMRNILVVPVAPHLSMGRAIVLPDTARVVIQVEINHHQAVLSCDGQTPIDLQDGDQIQVTASPNTARFIRLGDPGYFYRRLTRYMEQNPAAGEMI